MNNFEKKNYHGFITSHIFKISRNNSCQIVAKGSSPHFASKINSLQPNVAFHIEISHLFCK